jgi:hypothetical protein
MSMDEQMLDMQKLIGSHSSLQVLEPEHVCYEWFYVQAKWNSDCTHFVDCSVSVYSHLTLNTHVNLLFCGLFYSAFSIADCIASNGRTIGE